MKDIFQFHHSVLESYRLFSTGFSKIATSDLKEYAEKIFKDDKIYTPSPLIQLNMNYEQDATIRDLIKNQTLHPRCADIFQGHNGSDFRLYRHQSQAIGLAKKHEHYVVTTGTGSGKSLTFFIPIVNNILTERQNDSSPRIRALIIYPMNALANSQKGEIEKFLKNDPSPDKIRVGRYTGQETSEERQELAQNPPDILLTNYMMLEYMLTRGSAQTDRLIVEHCKGLNFLVLDELHTYRGRQGADVAMLVRRLREATSSPNMLCIGTSATMSSSEDQEGRLSAVSKTASTLFGVPVSPRNIIEETLRRITDVSVKRDDLPALLKAKFPRSSFSWETEDDLKKDPLAIWVELNIGVDVPETMGAPRRARPKTLEQLGEKLVEDLGLGSESVPIAQDQLREFFLAAVDKEIDGRKPFAFKLHQFISGPGGMFTTLEKPGERIITVDEQLYARHSGSSVDLKLFPVHFCCECGHEHIPVWYDQAKGIFTPRPVDETATKVADDNATGQLKAGTLTPYHAQADRYHKKAMEFIPDQDHPDFYDKLPANWVELSSQGYKQVKKDKRAFIPVLKEIDPQGQEGSLNPNSSTFLFSEGSFRYCPNCAHSFTAQGRDINRITGLSMEGRSSATTVIMLETLKAFQKAIEDEQDPVKKEDLRATAKALGFTDNRQDAALQAGYFNAFVRTALLRAGLLRLLEDEGKAVNEDEIISKLINALGMDDAFSPHSTQSREFRAHFLTNPDYKGSALRESREAIAFLLGYYLLTDLRYGWRRTNPNLEQLGLIEITYSDQEDLAKDLGQDNKTDTEAVRRFRQLSLDSRNNFLHTLFDELRFSLVLESPSYLSYQAQETFRKRSAYLTPSWQLEGKFRQPMSAIFKEDMPQKGRNKRDKNSSTKVISKLSGLVRSVLRAMQDAESNNADDADFWKNVKSKDLPDIIYVVFKEAVDYGIIVHDPQKETWALHAKSINWKLIPEQLEKNQDFYTKLYSSLADLLKQKEHHLFGFESSEHTAQVDGVTREQLEIRFRNDPAEIKKYNQTSETPLLPLPILFCSPTMELGVDISSLDIVYMRNVPPTPANYAQRSGRAGRSGQAALSITYCAALSPHDQWYFRKQEDMVCGVVKSPALDLSNQDLIDSHLRAIWLREYPQELPKNISSILDLEQQPDFPVREEIMATMSDRRMIDRALPHAKAIFESIRTAKSSDSDWMDDENYCQTIMEQASELFDRSFDNWRELYRSTLRQMEESNRILHNPNTANNETEIARQRYLDASRQKDLLTSDSNGENNDFYTYRYLASQGFIPGYNFPRLPLLAWIPGSGKTRNDMRALNRPRFLALSEFGPMSLIYHRGEIYKVHRIKLRAQGGQTGTKLPKDCMQVCPKCGHSRVYTDTDSTLNTCEVCGANYGSPLTDLYLINAVETAPQEHINIKDEERQRQGYELQTAYRFANGGKNKTSIQLTTDGKKVAEFTYGPAADVWRINKGWKRRKNPNTLGFLINPTSGEWSSADALQTDEDDDDLTPTKTQVKKQENLDRIIPYVKDTRNILIMRPTNIPTDKMATLQAALGIGIVRAFQVEDSEIIVEPLPSRDDRQCLLIYEAAEGGAGVLHQLTENADKLREVASEALQAMHMAKDSSGRWVDTEPPSGSSEDPDKTPCVRACYRCLLNYRNQTDHKDIDRHTEEVLSFLKSLADGTVKLERQQETLATTGDSSDFLALCQEWGLPAPDDCNKVSSTGETFIYYAAACLVIPHHEPTQEFIDWVENAGQQILRLPKDTSQKLEFCQQLQALLLD